MPANEPSAKDMLDHAERYFALHAAQRMSLFSFFVVVAGTLGAAIAASLQLPKLLNLLGVGVGVLLAVTAFVFWKLDQRSAFLVKHAEDSLRQLEDSLPISAARLFSLEPERSREAIRTAPTPFLRMWTYGSAFRLMFWSMGLTGIIGAVLAWGRYAGWWTL